MVCHTFEKNGDYQNCDETTCRYAPEATGHLIGPGLFQEGSQKRQPPPPVDAEQVVKTRYSNDARERHTSVLVDQLIRSGAGRDERGDNSTDRRAGYFCELVALSLFFGGGGERLL